MMCEQVGYEGLFLKRRCNNISSASDRYNFEDSQQIDVEIDTCRLVTLRVLAPIIVCVTVNLVCMMHDAMTRSD
jgi:hypothetical protein